MPVYLVGLSTVYSGLLWAANYFVDSETPKHNAFDLTDEIFGNLNSISNNFQEKHDFLILKDSNVILSI